MTDLTNLATRAVRRRLPFVLGAALLVSATAASAASPSGVGLNAACVLISNSGTLECDFPVLPANKGLEIQYVSGICTANAASSAAIWGFQVVTTPPNSNVAVPYQVAIPSGLNTFYGSPTAMWTVGERVKLYAKPGSAPKALLYMAITPPTRRACPARFHCPA